MQTLIQRKPERLYQYQTQYTIKQEKLIRIKRDIIYNKSVNLQEDV